jgi:hypothetical protein
VPPKLVRALRQLPRYRTTQVAERQRAQGAGCASAALQELARSDSSVVCDPAEAAEAVSWARRHSAWLDEPAGLWIATW